MGRDSCSRFLPWRDISRIFSPAMSSGSADVLTDYGIAMGSNLGDRLSHLHAALGALGGLGELRADRKSVV